MSANAMRWQRFLAILVITVMVAASFVYAPKNVSAKPAPVYQTIKGEAQKPVGFAVSQPLSVLAKEIVNDWQTPVEPNQMPIQEFRGGMQIPRVIEDHPVFDAPRKDLNRPVIEPDKKLFDVPSPALDWQWAGLSQGVNRAWYSYGVYPPDTQGDISSDHYIQVVNIQMEIWSLNDYTQYTGTPLPLYVGPIDALWKGSGLTACETSEDGDPVVIFDEYAGRWILSQFALPNYPYSPFYECIAVSATNDPMGTWYLYQYSFPVMNDYPKFGVWHDAYYMSINQFDPSSSPAWRGQGVAAFDKAAMQAGNPNASMIYIDTSAACVNGNEMECYLGGMLPADADGATLPTGPEVFMQFDDDAWGYSPDQLQLWTFVPDFNAGTGTFSHLVDLSTASFDSEVCANYTRNCIPQYGTSQGLDAISDRLMYRLQYRNFGSYSAMVVNHTVDVSGAYPKGQAGVRWYELRNTGSGWSIYQQGTIGDPAVDDINRWMASAAMDSLGNINIGYSASSATMYPGIRYTVHLVTDPPGTTRTERVMVNGGGAQTASGGRWGDYSMMSVIPDSPYGGCDLVYTQEYLRGTTPAEWYTWLGWFHNQSCYTGDATAPDTTITDTGTAGPGSTTAEFTFSGSDNVAVASYECSLDGAAFATCTSPKSYTGLANGSHTFLVRAIDTSSNVDPTPASYTWNININAATFVSQAINDGFVTESLETSNVGNAANATNTFFQIGDFLYDRQVKGILSFDTSALPDGAVVIGAEIKMRYYGVVGTNPYTTHGPLLVDIATPFFGTSAGLVASDFQAAASGANVANCGSVATANWYSCSLTTGFGLINLTGLTQFRLGFTLDDNDDLSSDLVRLYSGNAIAAYRPVLVVTYYIP